MVGGLTVKSNITPVPMRQDVLQNDRDERIVEDWDGEILNVNSRDEFVWNVANDKWWVARDSDEKEPTTQTGPEDGTPTSYSHHQKLR